MMTSERVEVLLSVFLNSEPDRGEWLTSLTDRFYPDKGTSVPIKGESRWGPGGGLNVLEKRRIFFLLLGFELRVAFSVA
jgi:hypothetical protein